MGTRVRTLLFIQALVLPALVAAVACSDRAREEETVAADSTEVAEPPETQAGPAAVEPEDPGPQKRIFARRFVVQVRTAPDPEAFRIGYLRGGAVLTARTSRPVASDGCDTGWYELETGGFVCTGDDAIAFDGRRLPEVRAAQPDRAADLPYQYAYARRNDVPVYRGLPTDEDAAEFEGYVIPGAEPPEEQAPSVVEGAGPPATAEDTPASTPAGIGGAEDADSELAMPEPEPEEPAGPPTLADLTGERGSILLRRMMKGFYVSLDRDFRAGARRYWRTQQHEFIPYAMLNLKTGSTFEGAVLGDEGRALPYGWILSSHVGAYDLREDGRLRRARGAPGYHASFPIVGEHEQHGQRYWLSADGHAYREPDVTRVEARARPEEVGEGEKWIDVDLTTQTLVAYEGDTPVFATLVSTGIVISERTPDLNHPTPTGVFRIRAKHLATTMDGDNAFDGPYSIQDVAYVQYYEQGYALHSAFWHDLFGKPKSHGCVNLSPRDARWLFGWTDPQLPEGWHGVYPEEGSAGTWVFIHGETPPRRR